MPLLGFFIICCLANHCFAGEDYGGVAQLCFHLYILNPDGTKAKLTTSARRVGKNRIVTVKPHTKTYSYSSNSCSFIKTERWLRSPFPDGYTEIKAEADCLLKFEFTTSDPPKGEKYWCELRLFVNDKLVPENEFTVRYEKRFNHLQKERKKVPYTYKRGKKKYTSYRYEMVTKDVKYIPRPQNDGIIFNSYRRVIFTQRLKKGESFKHRFEVKAVSAVEYK
jgi:hypothetical protein